MALRSLFQRDEIPLIDEDKDGKFSDRRSKPRQGDMMPELKKYGFMTWLKSGAKIRPPSVRSSPPASTTRRASPCPTGTARPATVAAADAANKRATRRGPRKKGPRNLVYVMRFELPQPGKFVSVTSFDPDDFIRIEFDKNSVPAGCTLGKHPSLKAEFIRGYPVFADIVTCQLP
jgi:hypothetical protein